MTIVYRPYRPKRPLRRKAQPAEIAAPMIVTAKSKRGGPPASVAERISESRIVTAKHPPRSSRFGDVPDMTPEEHKRRGDAADELLRRFKREIATKLREGE